MQIPATQINAAGATVVAGTVQLTSADITTASTSFVDLTGATITMTTGATRVLLSVAGSWFINVSGTMHITLLVDGANQGGTNGMVLTTFNAAQPNVEQDCSFSFLTGVLSAASHTFKVQWRVSANTGTMHASAAAPFSFSALETRAVA